MARQAAEPGSPAASCTDFRTLQIDRPALASRAASTEPELPSPMKPRPSPRLLLVAPVARIRPPGPANRRAAQKERKWREGRRMQSRSCASLIYPLRSCAEKEVRPGSQAHGSFPLSCLLLLQLGRLTQLGRTDREQTLTKLSDSEKQSGSIVC